MSYKERARAYFSAVNAYDAVAIERMVDENYIQHNPFVPTGRAAFVTLLPKLKAHGSKIKNVRMLEDGSHVIMHHQWRNAAPFGSDQMVAFHIIRFDSKGLIAEHWNIMMKDVSAEADGTSLADGATQIEDLHETKRNKGLVADLFEILIKVPKEKQDSLLSDIFRERSDAFASPDLQYQRQHKVFGEGNFTLSISEGTSRGVSSAFYDLFRIEKGQIAEHWRIVQEIPKENLANDNTMFGF